MTDLVVIFGPPAVGKAAVGTALAALHREIDGKHRMNSAGDDFPYPEHHMLIDTQACAPPEAAQLVCAHDGFARSGA
jgi:hypothetical protein